MKESVLKRMPFNAAFKESKFAKGLLKLPLQDSINPGWWICFLAAASSRWTAVRPNDLGKRPATTLPLALKVYNESTAVSMQFWRFGVMASSHTPSWPCLSCMDLDRLHSIKFGRLETFKARTLEPVYTTSGDFVTCNLPRNNGYLSEGKASVTLKDMPGPGHPTHWPILWSFDDHLLSVDVLWCPLFHCSIG